MKKRKYLFADIYGSGTICQLFLLMSLILGALPVSAQYYSESRRTWDEGPLTWDDFQGKPLIDEVKQGYASSLSVGYYYGLDIIQDHYRRYYIEQVKPLMHRYESWDSAHTDLRLLSEQALFDMSELYCRKATIDALNNREIYFNDIFSYYQRQREERVKEMIVITDECKDSVAMVAYYDDLQQELKKTSISLDDLSSAVTGNGGVSLYLGVAAQIPGSRVFNHTVGMDMGFEFLDAKSRYGFGVTLQGGGTSRMDVYTSKGSICEGDAVNAGSVYVFYGRDVWRGGRVAMAPFIGLGAGFYDLVNRNGDNGDKSTPEVKGLRLMGGLLTDYIFFENISVPLQGYVSRNTMSLRLMPYVSLTNYGCGVGWTPALNMSVLLYLDDLGSRIVLSSKTFLN